MIVYKNYYVICGNIKHYILELNIRMLSFNNSKKDKTKMVTKNNLHMANRNDDEIYLTKMRNNNTTHVDRIMLERQMTTHNYDNDEHNKGNVGDITGEEFNDETDVYDKGMPVRSAFSVRKSKFDNNSHLDFDLFEKIDKQNMKQLTYDNISEGEYADIDNAMKTITKSVNPYDTCVSDINITTTWIHSKMFMINQNVYIVNGFGLFMGFGTIYLISTGNTEIELKNYFGFQSKKHLNAGLLTVREKLNENREQIVIDNYLINDMNIPNNINTAKKLKSLIFSIIINKDYAMEETTRVNKIIKTISNFDNTFSLNTISNTTISLVSVAKLSPLWAYKVDNIVKGRFRGDIINFIRFMGKTFDYHEDSEYQLIEIPMQGDIFVIGFIIPKQNFDSPITLKTITTAINFMKPTILDEVIVPAIKKRYKTRLNKTLQNTGLKIVYSEGEIESLFPEGGHITDCIQYTDIEFSIKGGNKRSNNKGYRTTRKFVANKSIEFYLRNTENNCIMMMGRL